MLLPNKQNYYVWKLKVGLFTVRDAVRHFPIYCFFSDVDVETIKVVSLRKNGYECRRTSVKEGQRC